MVQSIVEQFRMAGGILGCLVEGRSTYIAATPVQGGNTFSIKTFSLSVDQELRIKTVVVAFTNVAASMKHNQSNIPVRGGKGTEPQLRCTSESSRDKGVHPDAGLTGLTCLDPTAREEFRQSGTAEPSHYGSSSQGQSYRKAIRSHVMRGVHSKRREKNNLPARKRRLFSKGEIIKDETLSSSGISGSSPESDSTGISSSTSRSQKRVLYPTNGTAIAAESRSQSQSSTRSGSPSGRMLWDPVVLSGLVNVEGSVAHASQAVHEAQELSKPTRQTAVLSTISSDNPGPCLYFGRWNFNATTPYALLQIEGGPPLCMNSRGWPFPQPLGTDGPKISMWMAGQNIPAPVVGSPRLCLHKSAQVLPYIGNSAEYFLFKGQTISWINSRLSDPAYSTSDVTIGSILQLISFEAGRGSAEEASQHINGLERIVALRGGIETFTHDRHLLVKIMLLDLLVAIKANTQPRLQLKFTTLPYPITPHILGTGLPVCPDSPLYRRDLPVSELLRNASFSPESIELMRNLQDLTLSQSQSPSSRTEEQRSLLASIHCLLSPSTPPSSTLSQAIHFTSYLHFLALSDPPTPLSLPSNHQTAIKLIHLLENPENDLVFDTYPGIFLWILLIASAASENGLKEHAFVISVLLKVANGSGYGWWLEMSDTLRCFGRLKRASDRVED